VSLDWDLVPNRDARQPSVWTALHGFWRDNVRRQGVRRTLRILADELLDFLRDCMPSRRRQRYGDIEYDFDYRVDTTASNVSRRDHLVGLLAGTPYQPCDPELFRATVGALPIDYAQFTFVDIGSGKGRALLLAAEYPFRRILGVEWMPELHRIAGENVARFQSSRQQCFDIEPICRDAREFTFPSGPLVVFLFNPLPEAALQTVIGNLQASLGENRRAAWVVYHNPLLAHLLEQTSLFRKVGGDMRWAIYAANTNACGLDQSERFVPEN
jgi:SAM-dependent methyltransferase